jgi:hypothetical protein
LSHAIPPIDALKKSTYCKWHNSYSHATNNCKVFLRQIQSAINGGQLCFKQMQVDNNPFPVNIIDLQGAKVLAQPEQAESTKGNNVIIGKERHKSLDNKFWSRKVALKKAADGKETLKITLKVSEQWGQANSSKQD